MGITIDCHDPARLAAFWSALLDLPLSSEHQGAGWASVGSRHDPQPRLTFQQVPEPKTTKTRLHLDIEVDDLDQACAHVLQLGGASTGERHEYPEGVVVVMQDPEANEFCLVSYVG